MKSIKRATRGKTVRKPKPDDTESANPSQNQIGDTVGSGKLRMSKSSRVLHREAFATPRVMDFLSEKELVTQIGHPVRDWWLVLLKELIDNALDACEEAGTAPSIKVTVDEEGLTVADNGPGIPSDVVPRILDFSIRVSSREAYVSPSRGAQGNALKTVFAMPFVLSGEMGRITIRALGIRHEITIRMDHIRQVPIISHQPIKDDSAKTGTSITVHSPSSDADKGLRFLPDDLAGNGDQDLGKKVKNDDSGDGDDDDSASPQPGVKSRFFLFADNYTFINPHLSLQIDWFGERLLDVKSRNPGWDKWNPCDPTSPHWYEPEHLTRLISAKLAHEGGGEQLVRDFVGEFRGLSSTAKRGAVLQATGLHRALLTALIRPDGTSLDDDVIRQLLVAMKSESKPIKPSLLGVIGKEFLKSKFVELGCESESFNYCKVTGEDAGLPWVLEAAFGWCPSANCGRIITGVNFSSCIVNPFRELGQRGYSLDKVLWAQRVCVDEPIVLLIHLTCPRVAYTDRGKSAIVIE